MYALLVEVRIDPARIEEAERGLHEEVVPQVSSAPGFVRGIWAHNKSNDAGTGLVVFESEEQAEQMAAMVPQQLAANKDAPITLERTTVLEVVAEA
jgi:hypothetical protein